MPLAIVVGRGEERIHSGLSDVAPPKEQYTFRIIINEVEHLFGYVYAAEGQYVRKCDAKRASG